MFPQSSLSSVATIASPAVSSILHAMPAMPELENFPKSLCQGQPIGSCEIREEDWPIVSILFPSRNGKGSTCQPLPVTDPKVERDLQLLKQLILAQKPADIVRKRSSSSLMPSTMENIKSPSTPALITFGDWAVGEEGAANKERRVGAYTVTERQCKIKRYKEKVKRRRAIHPISRTFNGRRNVAFAKKRVNGRFSKLPAAAN